MLARNLRRLTCLRTTSTSSSMLNPNKAKIVPEQLSLLVAAYRNLSVSIICNSSPKTQSTTNAVAKMSDEDYKSAGSVYDFTVKDNAGNDVKLDKYKGHPLLIVNIASKCGLTKNNYQKITQLKEKYYEQGLRILSFPCNQFGGQMPEANGEEMVCHLRDAKADVGDVFAKINVNGKDADPLYKYLKHKQGGTLGDAIKWNFTKFLVDKNGQPVKRYSPTTDPMDIAQDIEKYL